MPWTFTEDVEAYAAAAGPLLLTDPVRATAALTVVEDARAGTIHGSPLFGWYAGDAAAASTDAPVDAAMSLTPPHLLLIAAMPDGAAAALADELRARGAPVPGALGAPASVRAFAEAWLDGPGGGTEILEILYRLERLVPPASAPGGRPRPAREEEAELLVSWFDAFSVEAGMTLSPAAPTVAERIADGRLWVQVDTDDRPVAMAARNRTAAGVARIGPVFTPPPERRHGHAAVVTAACAADARERGAREVVLFADAANPTSNAVYRRIGFRPVDERLHLTLEDQGRP